MKKVKVNNIVFNYTLKKIDESYIGYIIKLDLPFTSPSEEKAKEISIGLIKNLFNYWESKSILTDKIKQYSLI